jgi:anti-sigma factor RsiW
MHPSSATLTALHDGQLAPGRAARVAAHAQGCGRCRDEYRRIAAECGEFRRATPAVDRADTGPAWERLQTAFAERGATRASLPEAPPSAMRDRVLAELCGYFGSGAAASFETVGEQELLEQAETLLAAFLGQRSAAAIREDLERGAGRPERQAEVF